MSMDLSIKNRLLVFANDAAGGSVTAAYIYLNKHSFDQIFAFSNGAAKRVYSQIIKEYISTRDIEFHSNDVVVTGTSGIDSSYEMGILKKSKKFKVKKTITIVDSIENFEMRFLLDGEIIESKYLPDEIWVFEKGFKSKNKDLSKKIVYKENIYTNYLKKLLENSEVKIKHPFVNRYKNEYIVVLTEYLYELYGLKYGFTEYEMLENILNTCSLLSLDLPIFIKLHPRESKNKFNILLRKYSDLNFVKDDCNIHELIYYSKAVLGINSSVFLESKLFKKPTFSIQLNSSRPIENANFLEKDIIHTIDDLKSLLINLL